LIILLMSAHSIRLLLHNAIDYAGLFPPAALGMAEAVRNYASYRNDLNNWALGRFIVPVARLREFEEEALKWASDGFWKISVLGGPNMSLEQKIIAEFNAKHTGRFVIDTVEVKAATPDEIQVLISSVSPSLHLFVEIPIADDPTPLLATLQGTKFRAKVRTGGVTAEVFPRSDHLARFIWTCAQMRVAFKATAGLHHPLRAVYPLTYKPGSETGTMYGYLNVLLAAVCARQGMDQEELVRLLEEESVDAFEFEDTGVSWRAHHFTNDMLRETREHFFLSFGSCSFREPMDELTKLRLL
jgi:hypothetical protein